MIYNTGSDLSTCSNQSCDILVNKIALQVFERIPEPRRNMWSSEVTGFELSTLLNVNSVQIQTRPSLGPEKNPQKLDFFHLNWVVY